MFPRPCSGALPRGASTRTCSTFIPTRLGKKTRTLWEHAGQTLNGSNLTFVNGLLTGGTINDAGWNGDARYTKRASNNEILPLHVNWLPSAAWLWKRTFSTPPPPSRATT